MKNFSSPRFITESATTLKNTTGRKRRKRHIFTEGVYPKTLIKQTGVIGEKLTPTEIIQHFKNLPKNPNWTDFEREFVGNGKLKLVPRNAYPVYLKWLHTGKLDGQDELARKFAAIDEIELRHEEIFFATGGSTMDDWKKTPVEKFKTIKAHELARTIYSMIAIKRRIGDSRSYLEKQKDKFIKKNKFAQASTRIDKLEKLYQDALSYIERNIFKGITEDDLSRGHCLDLKVADDEISKLNDKIWEAYQKNLAENPPLR